MATLDRAVNNPEAPNQPTESYIRKGKSIVVTSTQRDKGKSAGAVALAQAAAMSGRRTILVDADLEESTLDDWLDLDSKDGLTSLTQNSHIAHEIEKLLVHGPVDDLSVLPAGRHLAKNPRIAHDSFWRYILDLLCQFAELIIINAPPIKSVPEAMPMATNSDVVLEFVALGKTPAWEVNECNDLLEKAGSKILGVVVH
jgi:Mrp family chromosome partitioning ATPase